MFYFLWFCLGVVLAMPLLILAERVKLNLMTHLMGASLVFAAIIYLGFALVWGDTYWLLIEFSGVVAYGIFYLLAVRFSAIWLSVGWLLHPIWDVVLHLNGPGSHVAPEWYAVACLSFDIAVAAYIFKRLRNETETA
ncbi:MAG TPA: hypothetical protein ENI05_15105 [Porticoccus sp.]|nr:hypothetical protein [Porticoccus sp.]